MPKALLVLGAREGSIGHFVARQAANEWGGDWSVTTAGPTSESVNIDLTNPLDEFTKESINAIVALKPWRSVICTIGVNSEGVLDGKGQALTALDNDFQINVLAPLAILERWLRYWETSDEGATNLHFVVISSNSAHVPRSTGLPYNTTKAALSMAIRCVARDIGRRDPRISVYSYEPGWVSGTPMSRSIEGRLPAGMAPTRTPGNRMLTREDLAKMIVNNLELGHALNGSTIRVDGGEV